MFEITLPESGKVHPLKSLSRPQVKEVQAVAAGLIAGTMSATDYQDKVIGMAYPDLTPEVLDTWAGADAAHLARVTADYSILGPASIKNSLRSGDGTATA
jgi:hypothetical protein